LQTLQEIAEIVKNLKSATIFTHTRADGDTLGSGLALYFALQQLHIPCEICNDGDIPEKFKFLEGIDQIKKKPVLDGEGYLCVDSAEEKRLGDLEAVFALNKRKKITVNIDHHISNTKYAQYNYVRECSSNSQNMAEFIPLLGVKIDQKIANALFMGMASDSGNFTHRDVDGNVFRAAASLIDVGVDVDRINYQMFKKQSKARAALYGATMSEIRYFLEDKLAVITTTKKMIAEYGAVPSDTEGFVDFPLSVDGVEVAVAIMEVKAGQYKLSLRSRGKTNVNAIAAVFGGGGHVLASGCMMFGDLEEVIDKLRYTVSQYLE
jgi:phosphoesterase RecJ-like protein